MVHDTIVNLVIQVLNLVPTTSSNTKFSKACLVRWYVPVAPSTAVLNLNLVHVPGTVETVLRRLAMRQNRLIPARLCTSSNTDTFVQLYISVVLSTLFIFYF
eukprot:SAG31_NODE_3467_length_4242_cov_1.967415_6_plen_102_part_00